MDPLLVLQKPLFKITADIPTCGSSSMFSYAPKSGSEEVGKGLAVPTKSVFGALIERELIVSELTPAPIEFETSDKV